MIGQANNVYIFPGVGLGAIVSRVPAVTDAMFLAAARALANAVGDDMLKHGALYPPITSVREVSRDVAAAVVRDAADSGLVDAPADIEAALNRAVWDPFYLPYRPA